MFWAGPAPPAPGLRTRKTNSPNTYRNSLASPTPQSPLPRPEPALRTGTVPYRPENTELSQLGPCGRSKSHLQSQPVLERVSHPCPTWEPQRAGPRSLPPTTSGLSPVSGLPPPHPTANLIMTSYSPRGPNWETARVGSLPPHLTSGLSPGHSQPPGLGILGMESASLTCFGNRNQAGVTPAATTARDWGGPGTTGQAISNLGPRPQCPVHVTKAPSLMLGGGGRWPSLPQFPLWMQKVSCLKAGECLKTWDTSPSHGTAEPVEPGGHPAEPSVASGEVGVGASRRTRTSPRCRRVTWGIRECRLCPSPDFGWPGLVSLVT